jgi:hypothetical protein
VPGTLERKHTGRICLRESTSSFAGGMMSSVKRKLLLTPGYQCGTHHDLLKRYRTLLLDAAQVLNLQHLPPASHNLLLRA